MHCPAEQVAFPDDLHSFALFLAERHLHEGRIIWLAWLLSRQRDTEAIYLVYFSKLQRCVNQKTQRQNPDITIPKVQGVQLR